MIQKDKLLHLTSGIGISILTYLTGFGFIGSYIVVFTWAITKEIMDKVSAKGTCDPYDFIWTLNGWFFIAVIYILIAIYFSIR